MTTRGAGVRAQGDEPTEGFSGTRTAEIVGITYRQLDYWARTDLVRPSLTDASGSGSRRRYSYRDLLELKIIKTLTDNGVDLKRVRVVFDYLRKKVDADIPSAHLVISGSSVLLCDGDEFVDVVKGGQGVLSLVLPLEGVKQQIDSELLPFEAPQRRAMAAAHSSSVESHHRATGS